MARLNEPPPPMDGSDILRKKLLRQNRDLAKSNATLTMRIRVLEQEKQHLICQKLELASRVLELEQKLERNSTQRIADQALEIRAKLEAQLADCMYLLSDLGQEPPRKRRQPASPRSGKASRMRLSIPHRSPPRRRIIESEEEAELRAMTEGRLVPIFESQHASRQTLNPEQIQALCSAAADSSNLTDSPELGPPPLSRFVDSDAGALMPPPQQSSPSPTRASEPPAQEEEKRLPSPLASPVKSAETKTETRAPELPEAKAPAPQPAPKQPAATAPDALRTGSKRKFANNDATAQDPSMFVSELPQTRVTAAIRSERKSKPLKELTSLRREAQAKQAAPCGENRKPLSVKSTNENMESPKKVSKPPASVPASPGKAAKAKGKARDVDNRVQGKLSDPVVIQLSMDPPTLPAPVTTVISVEEVQPTKAELLSPGPPTPTPLAPQAHDTPPPANISAMGETARPSRRSRASVSYAEPNLRDKMRRPTKELFDAVTGDGRNKSRHSTSRVDDILAASTPGSSASQDAIATSLAMPANLTTSDDHGVRSPLAQKTPKQSDRIPRGAAMPTVEDGTGQGPVQAGPGSRREHTSQSASKAPTTSDPYDFTASSPDSEGPAAPIEDLKPARRQSKSSRRLSSMADSDFSLDSTETKQKPKSTAGRKRASITHQRADRGPAAEGEAETVGTTGGDAAPRAIATGRRRSTMV